jgi:hypothetical protein
MADSSLQCILYPVYYQCDRPVVLSVLRQVLCATASLQSAEHIMHTVERFEHCGVLQLMMSVACCKLHASERASQLQYRTPHCRVAYSAAVTTVIAATLSIL